MYPVSTKASQQNQVCRLRLGGGSGVEKRSKDEGEGGAEASEEVKGLGRLTVESGLESVGFLFLTQEFTTKVLI